MLIEVQALVIAFNSLVPVIALGDEADDTERDEMKQCFAVVDNFPKSSGVPLPDEN